MVKLTISAGLLIMKEKLESFATKRRDRRAALAFLKKDKRYDLPYVNVTGRLGSYQAAMVQLGN